MLVAFQDEPWSNRVRWVPAENLHVTLRFLGDVSPERTDGLVDRVRAVATETDPFSCTLDEVGAVPKPTRARVLIARISPAAALVDLAARVEAAVVAAGLAPETRRFRPHVTLGRVRRPPLRGVTLSASLAPIRVAAAEVVLFQSDLGAGGAHYTPLARLPIDALD